MDNTILYVGGAVATGIFAVFGWVLRRSISLLDEKMRAHDEALQKRAEDLAAFKLHAAETYVTNSALEKAIDRFSTSIDAVFKKLESMDEKFDRRLDMKQDRA
jgi:predicted  nucleic acid-binding Zn-ribbon protein